MLVRTGAASFVGGGGSILPRPGIAGIMIQ